MAKASAKPTTVVAPVARITTSIKFSDLQKGSDGAIWELADDSYPIKLVKQFKSGKGTELIGTTQGIAVLASIVGAATPEAKATLEDGEFFSFNPEQEYTIVIKNKRVVSFAIPAAN